MELNDLRKYNLNYFAAIIGILFVIRSIFIASSISSYYSNFTIRLIITIVATLIGASGILLFNKDYKTSIAQYIISLIGFILGDLTGVYTFIFFVLAAILAYVEKEKSKNENILSENNNEGKITKIKLIYIPCISILILILLFASSMVLSDIESDARNNAINITELSADKSVEYEYPKVNMTGKLVSSESFDSVTVKTYWYDESGIQLDQTYDSSIKNEIKENQIYQLNSHYFGQKGDKLPSKAEIIVEDLKHDQIVFSKNVTF